MWPDRRLLELFQIEHPIVLAPMAGFGTVELAACADAVRFTEIDRTYQIQESLHGHRLYANATAT